MPPVCFFNFLFFLPTNVSQVQVVGIITPLSKCYWFILMRLSLLLVAFFGRLFGRNGAEKKTKQNHSQGATIQVCPLAVVQVFLVWTDKDWAVSRLKISLIRSDWSRLWKSPCGSWGVWNEEGQTSVRRHSPRSLNIFECLYIPPVHPLNPPPNLHLLAQCDLTQSLNFIFMTFTPC